MKDSSARLSPRSSFRAARINQSIIVNFRGHEAAEFHGHISELCYEKSEAIVVKEKEAGLNYPEILTPANLPRSTSSTIDSYVETSAHCD